MNKKSKITVKHILHTESKPYLNNNISYYSMYVQLTTERKTTRTRSGLFKDYYSKKDFEKIKNTIDSKFLVLQEITSLETVTSIIINELQVFEPKFASAYFNFLTLISTYDIDCEIFKTTKKVSLLEFFSNEYQTKNKSQFLLNTNDLQSFNKDVFYKSLAKFKWFLLGSKRNKLLLKKYAHLFKTGKEN